MEIGILGLPQSGKSTLDDFIASGGALAGAKAAGRLRLEGKDYLVQDGDIISFRFNV